MSRGSFDTIRDPAQAIAAAKCWISRWGANSIVGGITTDSFHPKTCNFCNVNADYLITAIDEFLSWSNLRDDTIGIHYEEPVEQFLLMSAEEQASAVHVAQGYR